MSHLFEMVTKLGLNSRSQPCWKHGGSGPGTVMNESRSYSPSAAAGPGVSRLSSTVTTGCPKRKPREGKAQTHVLPLQKLKALALGGTILGVPPPPSMCGGEW